MVDFALTKVFLCQILFLFLIHKLSLAKNYDIKMKAIYCYDIDPNFVYNVTCRIRAVRGKQGVIDKVLYYRNMSDVWVGKLSL